MIAVELSFYDDKERLAARPAHRDRLARLRAEGRLLAAGPWADDSGALLLFSGDDLDEVRRILAEDPYYTTPGVRITALRCWQPVVGTVAAGVD